MNNPVPGVPKRILFHNPAENLTGYIGTKKASDLEERSARSIAKLEGWSFIFRIRINPISHKLTEKFTNLRGETEIDFLATRGSDTRAFLVDGEISHYYAAWMRDVDARKTAEINDALKPYGIPPAVRVPYWELSNQDMSDRYWREKLL